MAKELSSIETLDAAIVQMENVKKLLTERRVTTQPIEAKIALLRSFQRRAHEISDSLPEGSSTLESVLADTILGWRELFDFLRAEGWIRP